MKPTKKGKSRKKQTFQKEKRRLHRVAKSSGKGFKINWFQEEPLVDPNPVFKKIFWGLAILFACLMPLLSTQYGIAGDETDMHFYGQDVLKYYTSVGEDRSFEKDKKSNPGGILKYYGALFDIAAEGSNNLLGTTQTAPYTVRHILSALFGFVAILFAGLTAWLIGGWRMGLLALIFMLVSPRFFGESMNNTKDIPFATTYIFALFFLIKYLKELPRPKWKTSGMLAMGIGLCINTRVGGLLLIPYLFLFVFLEMGIQWPVFSKALMEKSWRQLTGYTLLPLGIAISGYLLGSLFWPYALGNPITNPVTALSEMTKYPVNIRILYGGEHIWSENVPWDYLLNWIARTSPLVVLLGVLACLFVLPKQLKKRNAKFVLYIAFAAFFPVLYAITKKSNLYDGWRHFLFVYPSMVILAAFAWNFLLDFLKKKRRSVQYAGKGILALGVAYPLLWSVINHPNQVVYFNPLFGGIQGNYGKYDLDYYMNSVKQASDWLKEKEDLSGPEIVIATTTLEQVKQYFKDMPNVKVVYVRYYQRYDRRWDYGIFYNRFINKNQLLNGSFPPPQTVHSVTAGGVPLCVVVKQTDQTAQDAFEALKQRNYALAASKFELETKTHPNDELAWMGLGQCYTFSGNLPQAMKAFEQGLKRHPDNATMLYVKGSIQMRQNKLNEAFQTLKHLTEVQSRFGSGWFLFAQVQAKQGLRKAALESAQKALNYSGNNKNFIKQVQDWAKSI